MIGFRKGFLFLVLFFVKTFAGFAGEVMPEDSAAKQSWYLKSDSLFSFTSHKGYVPEFIHDFGAQAVAPFKMSTEQLVYVAAATGITMMLINVDDHVDKQFRNLKTKHDWINTLSPRVTMFGESYAGYFLASYALGGIAFNNHKAVRVTLLATQAALTAGTWVRVGKAITSRERPLVTYHETGHEGGKWYGFMKAFKSENKHQSVAMFDAFPSGHTSAAFSIATVFAMEYSQNMIVPIASYTAASLVAVSRLTEHEHWISDVFVGGCLGILCARQVVLHHREVFKESGDGSSEFPQKTGQVGDKKVEWRFGMNETGNGLSLSCIW